MPVTVGSRCIQPCKFVYPARHRLILNLQTMKVRNCVLLNGLIFILCLTSCYDKDGSKLRVNNTSNNPIYVTWTTDDTTLSVVVNPIFNPQTDKVEAHTIQNGYYQDASKGLFDGKTQKLSVFIFDAKVLESTPWDTIQAKNMVLKRYDFTLSELEKTQWLVTYP